MDHEGGLLQIGVFSRLSTISVRMLRHYQQQGLLLPAWVDASTGYRYYGAEQLAVAEHIRQLRDAGFSIAAMVRALDDFDDPTLLSARFQAQRTELLQQKTEVHDRLAALDRLIHRLKEPNMTYEVTITTLPAMTVASVRDTIADYGAEGKLWEQLMPQIVSHQVPMDGIAGATFHGEYRETDVDVEVWMQIPEAFPADPPVRCRALPERRVVTVTLRGSYEQMPDVSRSLGAYIAEHQLEVGSMFNIYRVSPAQDPNPENWVTDVCLPIVEEQ